MEKVRKLNIFKKLFAVLLCFVTLFMVGCDFGGNINGKKPPISEPPNSTNPSNPSRPSTSDNSEEEGGDEDFDFDTGDNNVKFISGTKVISKVKDYNISDAVGEENSEYYYNRFAFNISNYLYNVYFDLGDNLGAEIKQYLIPANDIDSYKAVPFASYPATQKVYLIDSIRYTITSVTQDSTKHEYSMVINIDKSWKFDVNNFTTYKFGLSDYYNGNNFYTKTEFDNSQSSAYVVVSDNTLTINGMLFGSFYDNIMNSNFKSDSYSEFYYGSEKTPADGKNKYYDSPYYQKYVEGKASVDAKNYYQDALEYAIYMFVLGYDMVEDSNYFDFSVEYNNGIPNGIKVGGWGNSKVDLSIALGNAKELYSKIGNYVGLSERDIANIKTFILEKMIGLTKNADGKYDSKFTVNTKIDGTTGSFELDRCYETVVDNILTYACKQVQISNGSGLSNIDSPYPMSKITDYKGDAFFLCLEDENGNDDASDPFRLIEEAEYQSMTFSFFKEDVGHKITDLALAFQYYNTTGDESLTQYYDTENGLTLNIGINYYDSERKIVANAENTFTIKYGIGSVSDLSEFEMPDETCFMFYTDEEDLGEGTAKLLGARVYDVDGNLKREGGNLVEMDLSHGIEVKESTLVSIDNGVLDMKKYFTEIDEDDESFSVLVDGSVSREKLRNYIRLNNSSTYGQYITLNPKAISAYDDCDYIEVYFDIQKEKGIAYADKIYDFKVALQRLLTDTEIDA